MFVLFFIIIFFTILLLIRQWKRRHVIRLGNKLGPGTIALPFVGHSYLFIGGNEAQMRALQLLGYDAIRNRGMASYWFGPNLYAVIVEPSIAEYVMKTCLEKADVMRMTSLVIGNGSIFAPVNIWHLRRKILLPNFCMRNIKSFMSVFNKQSAVMVEKVKNEVGAGAFSMWKYYTTYSMDAIAEISFGCELNTQKAENEFLNVTDSSMELLAQRICQPWLHSDAVYKLTPTYWTQLRNKKFLWDYVNKFIKPKRKEMQEFMASEQGSDPSQYNFKTILEMLLSTPNANWSDKEIFEEILVIIVAGNDTTAVAGSFLALMLSRHPNVQEKVYKELHEEFGDAPLTIQDLPRLKYLDAVVKETLRLFPSAPVITRKVEKDISLPNGITLIPGTSTLINIWAMHRDPRYWGDDAESFRPERFLESDKFPAYMPFSYGPRNCIGYKLAMTSLKASITTLLRNYKILPAREPVPPETGYPSVRLTFDLTMKDVDNFQVQFTPRKTV